MADVFDEENFGEETELAPQSVDWGVPGDYILGTFIKARHGVKTKYKPNSIYEFFAENGSFHKLIGEGRNAKPVEESTKINKGEVQLL